MTDQRDSFAREIDEELRRDQLLKLWEKYGTHAVAAAALVILGVVGFKYYEQRRVAASEAAGDRFTAAARAAAQDKSADAQKSMEQLAASGPASYAALARIRLAAADREAGKTEQALAVFEAISKQSGIDPILADYARLQAATLRVDTADWTEMQNRLNPLVADGNAWRFSARELLALAAQKAGRSEDARTEFQKLAADRDTPPSIRERARVMLAMLTEKELAKASPQNPPASDDKAKAGTTDGKSK
ncbi:MAG: tetratricopeptide repeat protein [Hyphomicrobiaceae bacterium]